MRRKTLTTLTAMLAVVCLCAALCITPSEVKSEVATVTVRIDPTAVDADENKTEMPDTVAERSENDGVNAGTKTEYTLEQLQARIISMLNMNYCYGASFDEPDKMAISSAVTLRDYAADVPGYGICVNEALVVGFAESFYGVSLDVASIGFDDAPEYYVPTPCTEIGTQYHKPISVTETENGYEVVTCVTFYYGGSDIETRIAHSVFVENDTSEFGLNLISCNLM